MKAFTIKSAARCAAAVATAALASTASAHAVLEYQVAPAGSSYKATFKITHGCAASATRQVAVDIPAGVRGARPMPKPGWTLQVQREKLPQPFTSHGRVVTDDVVRITWTAKTREDMLPAAYYDEFVLAARMPDKAGPIYWPVRQGCEEGRNDWVEIPAAGQRLSDLKAPAVLLEILPAAGGAEHRH